MNLGIVLSDQGKLDLAMEWFLSAQKLRPNSIEILQNLAMNLGRQGRSPEAIKYFEQVLRQQPEHVETHVNLAYALLCAGDYESGWREYEWRWKSDKHPGYRINRPLWNGEDIRDRTILLHTEQGFGDNLQLIRFAALVKKRAGLVLALCPTPLLKLIARCNGVDMAVEGSSYQPNCDVHAPLLSLPAIFGTTLDTLPAQVPYLVTDKMLVDHWGTELAKATSIAGDDGPLSAEDCVLARRQKPFRIGIAWQGNPAHSNDRWRSFRLANFAAIAELPGVRLISLQTDHGLDQLEAADRTVPGHRAAQPPVPGLHGDCGHHDPSRPGDHTRHGAGSPGGRPRFASLGRPLHGGRVALARRPRRHPVVSHHATFPSDHDRRLGRRLPADDGSLEGRASEDRRGCVSKLTMITVLGARAP